VPDLSLVPTDDLWAEVERRYDAAVLIVQQDRGGHDFRSFRFSGGLATCIGLLELMSGDLRATGMREKAGEGDEA
jgi:hypothetical protein